MPTLYQEKEHNFLEFLLSLFFVVLMGLVSFSNRVQTRLSHVTPFDFFLLTMATFRLTRLLVYDGIMQFFRDLFLKKKEIREAGNTEVKRFKPRTGIAKVVAELLDCPWCTGMWMAFFCFFLYGFFSQSYFFIGVLAVAGSATFIQICINWIGWKAEEKKIEVKKQEEIS